MMTARSLATLDPLEASRTLLGWTLSCGSCSGMVVETEAYREHGDQACHTFFRKTARDFVHHHHAGAVYIYLNYGIHWLLNFLTVTPDGERGFVLIRALEPLQGLDEMRLRRQKGRPLRNRDLCSGPAKLTQALGIGPEDHGRHLDHPECSFTLTPRADGEALLPAEIISGPRIGITRDAQLPWRFGVAGNPHLSAPFSIS